MPVLVLETAQAVKFAETIQEALQQSPAAPQGLADLETLPQRVTVMPADVEQVKQFIVAHSE